MRHYTIPIFIPENGCPNRCVFCNQRRISGCLHQPDQDEIREIIESRLATLPPGNRVEIGFFGGNFTGIDPELQETCLSIAQEYVDKGVVDGIRLSTRPDYISPDSLAQLGEYSVKTIELGAQSMDDEVLRLSGRGHTATDIRNASALILKSGFRLGLQMMTGLPGDTPEKSIDTANQIVSLGASDTRIYPTLVIRDTRLEELYRKGLYTPLTLDDAIGWTVPLVRIFEAAGIRILRVGLHPSDDLLKGDSLVAGPFHVAFGEMVYSELWKEELSEKIREVRGICDLGFRISDVGCRTCPPESSVAKEVKPLRSGGCRISELGIGNWKFRRCRENKAGERLLVEVPVGQINAAVGHSGRNKKWLMNSFKKVMFRENKELKHRQSRLVFTDVNTY